MAERIQLRRTTGWRIPPGVVKVDRTTRWGNPYIVCGQASCDHAWCTPTAEDAVEAFRYAVRYPCTEQPFVPTPDEIRSALAGLDLACWCPLDQPCHADVLLAVANPRPRLICSCPSRTCPMHINGNP